MAPLNAELQYYAYKHPHLTCLCKWILYIVTCPLCFSCCCFCCCRPHRSFGSCGTGALRERQRKRQEKKERMTFVHFEHKGRRLKRRQSLSIGASPPTSSWTKLRKKKTTSDQASSIFFSKLPVEVREQIYEYVLLGSGAVHWILKYKKMLPSLTASACLRTWDREDIACYLSKDIITGASGCSLLQTCRLVYTEVLPILYCNVQFAFNCTTSLRAFSQVTPMSKIQMIRSARIDISYHQWSHQNYQSLEHLAIFKSWKNLRMLYIVGHGMVEAVELFSPLARSAASDKYDIWLLLFEHESYRGKHNSDGWNLVYDEYIKASLAAEDSLQLRARRNYQQRQISSESLT